ncbi:MAG TPA: transporter substrate-binding domain-containing protein [Pseudomonas sp.]|jgi:polar amino acid transport system substrate-binding protein
MQMYRKCLLVAVATLAFTTGAFAVDKLKMGVEGAYPPFNNKDASGQVVGFDVEIGNALCAKMKVECEVVITEWNAMIPSLVEGKFDFVMSSMSITPERSALVDFTTPYYSNKLQFIAPKTSDLKTDTASIKDSLRGKTIGTQNDTVSATWLQQNLGEEVTIKLYDTQASAYADLAAGHLDAILADKYPSYEWLKSDAGMSFEFKGDPVYDNDKIGIAVRLNDPLRARLNLAIKEIIEDGSYKKINDKYFPFSIL